MLTLFAAKGTVAVAAHIALEETGTEHALNWISVKDGEQSQPQFLAINPKGRVPALLTDDGVVTETPAILEYIAERSGQLMPDTAFKRARARELMCYCASTFHVNHAHKLRQSRWTDDVSAHAGMAAKVPETMAASCAHVESQLPDTGWYLGGYCIADIHLHAVCRWLAGDAVDITDYPKLSAHFDAMLARPAVARVTAAHA